MTMIEQDLYAVLAYAAVITLAFLLLVWERTRR